MRVTGDIGVTASQFLDPAWKWRNVVSVALDHLCFPCIYLMDWGWVCPKATWRFELKTSRMIVQCPIQDHHIFITKSRYMYALAIYFLRGPNLHFHYMKKKKTTQNFKWLIHRLWIFGFYQFYCITVAYLAQMENLSATFLNSFFVLLGRNIDNFLNGCI